MLLRRGCRSERKQQQHERARHSLYQRDLEWRSVPLAVLHCVDEQLPQRERLASCNGPPDHLVIEHGSLARKEDVFHAGAPMRNYAR